MAYKAVVWGQGAGLGWAVTVHSPSRLSALLAHSPTNSSPWGASSPSVRAVGRPRDRRHQLDIQRTGEFGLCLGGVGWAWGQLRLAVDAVPKSSELCVTGRQHGPKTPPLHSHHRFHPNLSRHHRKLTG